MNNAWKNEQSLIEEVLQSDSIKFAASLYTASNKRGRQVQLRFFKMHVFEKDNHGLSLPII